MKKYEYGLLTWGGFYNEEYRVIHDLEEGFKYFDTEKERSDYIKLLKAVENQLKAYSLVYETFEGFNCRNIVTLHRVSEYRGVQYHTTNELRPYYPYDAAKYMLEYKWYLGFNDYPLGEDFDYEGEDIIVVEEWITGSFVLDEGY